MNLVTQLKGVHWAAIGLMVLGFGLAQLAKDPDLANFSAILNWAAGVIAAGGGATALGSHKVGSPFAGSTTPPLGYGTPPPMRRNGPDEVKS